MSVPKAVISAAGFGSRFFPVSVAINKTLLPIGSRPVIDYLLNELVDAGVREIAVVTLPGDDQIRRYVEPQSWVRNYFDDRGWADKYAPVRELHERLSDVTFTWLEQPIDGRYGTAIPALIAREFVGDSDWLLLSGDDLILRRDGGSDIADLIAARACARTPAAIQVTAVDPDRVSRYGIIRTRQQDGVEVLAGAVEKPKPEEAPTNLASISRFLLDTAAFDYLDSLEPDPRSGEYVSLSALLAYAQDHAVLVHTLVGDYHDCGNVQGWLDANLAAVSETSDSSRG